MQKTGYPLTIQKIIPCFKFKKDLNTILEFKRLWQKEYGKRIVS